MRPLIATGPVSLVVRRKGVWDGKVGELRLLRRRGRPAGSALCDGANFYFRKTKGPIPANNCMMYVDEVDEFCATLKAKGVRILEEPEDKPWGYRQFTLEDLNGHTLCVFRFSDGVE